jgi:thiol-disulfide isomerase/thioredoxin
MHLFGFLSALLISCSAGEFIDLSADDFDEALNLGPLFVKFYSPNCPHCIRMAPIWDKVASNGPNNPNSAFIVADVDCAAHSDLCNRFGVRGVPTMIFFKDGKMYKYQGAREYNDLVKFASGEFKKSSEVADIPPAGPSDIVGAASFSFYKLLSDLGAMFRFNRFAVMVLILLGFLVGSSTTFIVALLVLPNRVKPAEVVTPAKKDD